jgi:hypothetical protein
VIHSGEVIANLPRTVFQYLLASPHCVNLQFAFTFGFAARDSLYQWFVDDMGVFMFVTS